MRYLYLMALSCLLSAGSMAVQTVPPELAETTEKKQGTVVLLKQGDKMPDFIFEDIQGRRVSLKSFRGKYVLIDVWATWCGVCVRETPYFERLEEEFHNKRIAFVAVSADKKRENWEKAVKMKRNYVKQWICPEGEEAPMLEALGIQGIPRFVLLDRKGRIADMEFEFPSRPEAGKKLLKLKGI